MQYFCCNDTKILQADTAVCLCGESVVLTRHGQEVVRLTAIRISDDLRAKRLAAIREAQAAVGELPADFDAARSQDFLYDEDGLPA